MAYDCASTTSIEGPPTFGRVEFGPFASLVHQGGRSRGMATWNVSSYVHTWKWINDAATTFCLQESIQFDPDHNK
eukprot:scaffold31308_cov49-Attheya_sp.AAC.3